MNSRKVSELKHGAGYAYRRGCRCALCREWKRRDVAAYRARRGRRRERSRAVAPPRGAYVEPMPFPFRRAAAAGSGAEG